MCSCKYSTSILILGVLLSLVLNNANGQQLLPNGDPYFCVPANICPNAGTIDPRIITPDNNGNPQSEDIQKLIDQVFFDRIETDAPPPTPGVVSCPAGRFACYAQGSMSACGRSALNIAAVVDGNANPGVYPWQVYLMGPTGYIGSGSLLSPWHVLTATHKVLAYVGAPNNVRAVFGVIDPATTNFQTQPQAVGAAITIWNQTAPFYNNATLKNDIAIIRLATPVSILNPAAINTLCIPPAASAASPAVAGTFYTNPPQRCVVSGWGQIQPTNSPVPTRLKQVRVNTTDINTCDAGFLGKVDTATYLDKTGGELCAGGEAQKDACFQDGGAPLVCGAAPPYSQAGIVIWGKSCGQAGVYGVYTNVPFYRAWVLSVLATPVP